MLIKILFAIFLAFSMLVCIGVVVDPGDEPPKPVPPPGSEIESVTMPKASNPARATTRSSSEDPVELMMIISDPPWRDRDRARRRFAFILDALTQVCSDVDTRMKGADYLAVMWKNILAAGLEDSEGGLVGLADTSYSLLRRVRTFSASEIECAEPLAMYGTLRQGGYGKTESSLTVQNLYRAVLAGN